MKKEKKRYFLCLRPSRGYSIDNQMKEKKNTTMSDQFKNQIYIHCNIADVVEWSRALDIRLSD